MKIAMGVLAVLAVIGGVLQIPGVDDVVDQLPGAGVRRLARWRTIEPTTATAWVGLVIGAVIGAGRHHDRLPHLGRQPGIAAPAAASLRRLHTFLVHKWYFDELIDFVVVRPALCVGRLAESVLERSSIGGGITGGITGVVRAGSAGGPRRADRLPALLRCRADRRPDGRGPLLPGLEASHDALDPDLAAAGDRASSATQLPPPAGRRGAPCGQPDAARRRDLLPGALQIGHAGLQFVTDGCGSARSGSTTSSGSTA